MDSILLKMQQSWSVTIVNLIVWGTRESQRLLNFLEREILLFSLFLASEWVLLVFFFHTNYHDVQLSLWYSIFLILSVWGTAACAKGMVGLLCSPDRYFSNAARLNSKGQQNFSHDPSGRSERSCLPWERIDFRDIWCYNGGVGIFQFQSTHSGWERLS